MTLRPVPPKPTAVTGRRIACDHGDRTRAAIYRSGHRTRRELRTPAQGKPFVVAALDAKGLVLLLGAKEARTPVSWSTLEGVVPFLDHRGWVEIGSVYEVGARSGTLDSYLKGHIRRATAGWVAVVLETAGVVDIDRSRPARVRLNDGWRRTA